MLQLEEAMRKPLPAREFEKKYFQLIGDDGLMDMVSIAARLNPDADIRPAIAATLELWTRWVPAAAVRTPWEVGARDRALFLAEQYFDHDLPQLVRYQDGLRDAPEAAAIKIALVTDQLESEAVHYNVARIMPGIYAVHVPQTGELYRVDCIFNMALPCDPTLTETLKETLFGEPAPAMRH